MKKYLTSSLLFAGILMLSACGGSTQSTVSSPDGKTAILFNLSEDGSATYSVTFLSKEIIKPSALGFSFTNQPELSGSLKINEVKQSSTNETWEMPWGEQRLVKNEYKEMVVSLEETATPNRKFNVYFRVYNDGIGFRYEFLEQAGVDTVFIKEELTEFNLTSDHTTWWLPGDWDSSEHLNNTSPFSKINATSKRNHPSLAATYIPVNGVLTPVTMRTADGIHLSFHEAALIDFAEMTLQVDTASLSMKSNLVGSARTEHKTKRALPFVTPWRTIQISENAAGLIDSRLVLNLNEPNKIGDVSWFTPMKYVGIWWEMHIGVSTWDYEATQFAGVEKGEKVKAKHGATTENAKRYIDFASKNGIKGLLVEGWNTGWDRWIGFEDREGVFDFVTPYPDYDLKEVVRYGKEKGVEVIMHHETSAAPRTYEQQLDTAYNLMQLLGIHSVKSGYVGPIIPKGEYHGSQWMINHYNNAAIKAIDYQVAVNAHEPIKDTGLRRTYPNIISREGLRGQEFNAWSVDGGNPPEHIAIVAFTRMLSGPIDFTPGVFELSLKTKPNNQINTTLAHQLALFVVIYSPIQMACDLPENYEGHPAFQFIRDVGVDWEQSKTLAGEVGDYVVIAREERNTGNWFVGAVTDENAREITIDFDFLPEGKNFQAAIYSDGANAHWKENAQDIQLAQTEIKKGDKRTFKLAAGGGLAISLLKK